MEKQANMEGKYADPGMAGQNGTAADGTGIRRYDGPFCRTRGGSGWKNCRRKSTRRCCAPIFCCGWRCGSSAVGGIFPGSGSMNWENPFPGPSGYPFQPQSHGWGRSRRFSGHAGWGGHRARPPRERPGHGADRRRSDGRRPSFGAGSGGRHVSSAPAAGS